MENKSLKFWKFFAFLLMALNITLIVFLLLKPPMGRFAHEKDRINPGNFIVEKLKFTEPQQAEFKKLREAHHDSIMILTAEGKKLRTNFFNGLTSDPVNNNVDSIVNNIAENQRQVELTTYTHFKEVKSLCTSEQKVIFNDIILDVIKKMGEPQPGWDRRHHERR